MLDPLFQFALEILRALLVDELSGRVRRKLARWSGTVHIRTGRQAFWVVNRRNQDRLIHKMLTELEEHL
jgi:hypothetical protein